VRERVARSRVLVARGYAVAAVARVLKISRQAIYRTPRSMRVRLSSRTDPPPVEGATRLRLDRPTGAAGPEPAPPVLEAQWISPALASFGTCAPVCAPVHSRQIPDTPIATAAKLRGCVFHDEPAATVEADRIVVCLRHPHVGAAACLASASIRLRPRPCLRQAGATAIERIPIVALPSGSDPAQAMTLHSSSKAKKRPFAGARNWSAPREPSPLESDSPQAAGPRVGFVLPSLEVHKLDG